MTATSLTAILLSVADPTLRAYNVRTLEDRVRALQWLAWRPEGGLRDPLMRRIGLLVTRGCKSRDDICELQSIFNFTVYNVRYTGDIAGKDTFSTALRTLQYGGEDCDGHSVLNVVLAMENGFDCKWRITSNTGATWDHIYAMAAYPKHRPRRWIAIDTTLGRGRFGAEPPRAKYRDFPITKRDTL